MSDTPAATEVKDRLKHAYQTVGIANLDAIAALDAAEEQAASLRDDILGWINIAALLSETVVEQEEALKEGDEASRYMDGEWLKLEHILRVAMGEPTASYGGVVAAVEHIIEEARIFNAGEPS